MTEQQPQRRRQHHYLRTIVIIGVVALLASAAIAAYMTGYFKTREKVALLTWNNDPYWDLVVKGAQEAADSMNADLIVIRSDPDEKTQTQHLQELISQGVKAIAISPNNPAGQADALKEAAGKVVLVTFDSDAPGCGRKAFIGTDNYDAGQSCGDEVKAAIPDGGEVIISVGTVGMSNASERRQGLIDNLLDRHPKRDRTADAANAELKGDKYSVVATVVDGGDPAKATAGVADAIKAHPNVKCVVGLFSYSAPAIAKALQQANLNGKIQVVGFDESDDTQAGIEGGTIYSSILQDQWRTGYMAVDVMLGDLRNAHSDAPADAPVIYSRIRVMKKDNMANLREDRMIHQPAKKS